jgi:hypothetical protein
MLYFILFYRKILSHTALDYKLCVQVSAALTIQRDGQNLIFIVHLHCKRFNPYSSTNRDLPAVFQDCLLHWFDVASLTNQFSTFRRNVMHFVWKSLKFRLRLDPSGRRHCVIRNVGKLLPIEAASSPQPQFRKTLMLISLFYLYILYITNLFVSLFWTILKP